MKRNFYYYLYYSIYKSMKLFRSNTIVEWTAVLAVSILIAMNIFTILDLMALNNSNFTSKFSRFFGQLLGVVVIVINYFVFIKGGKYKKIVEEYDSKQANGGLIVMAYVVFTIWCTLHFGGQIRELNLRRSNPTPYIDYNNIEINGK